VLACGPLVLSPGGWRPDLAASLNPAAPSPLRELAGPAPCLRLTSFGNRAASSLRIITFSAMNNF
jgi:hypothetical protein